MPIPPPPRDGSGAGALLAPPAPACGAASCAIFPVGFERQATAAAARTPTPTSARRALTSVSAARGRRIGRRRIGGRVRGRRSLAATATALALERRLELLDLGARRSGPRARPVRVDERLVPHDRLLL